MISSSSEVKKPEFSGKDVTSRSESCGTLSAGICHFEGIESRRAFFFAADVLFGGAISAMLLRIGQQCLCEVAPQLCSDVCDTPILETSRRIPCEIVGGWFPPAADLIS